MNNQIDEGANSVTLNDEQTVDNRAIANAKAAEIAQFITTSESKLAITAKEHGVAMLRSHYNEGVSLDVLIGESKLAAGFKTLGTSEAGKKAKSRLNNYFSTYRLLAERWNSDVTEEQRNGILAGDMSPHYVAALIRKADADATRAEAKALAEAEKEASLETPSLVALAEAFLASYEASSMEDRNEAFDAIGAIFAAVDRDTLALQAEGETVEQPEQIAA